MITNERQYQISKAQVAKFRAAIDAPDSSTRTLHPRVQKALREAAQSQLDDLVAEVAEHGAIRLPELLTDELAMRVIRLGEVEGDDAGIVSGDHVLTARRQQLE